MKINVAGCIVLMSFSWIIFGFVAPHSTYAEESSFTVSPDVLKIRAAQTSSLTTPLAVTNSGNNVLHLQLELRFFRDAGKDDGSIVYISQTNAKDAKSYQDLSKDVLLYDADNPDTPITSLDLGPKQKKSLLLKISLANNILPSDYYFSILFMTEAAKSDTRTSQIAVHAGIAIQVLLSLGQTNSEAYINDFSVPFYIQTGPVPFNLRIANVGKQFVTPKGAILIKNMFGQIIGKVDIAPASVLSSSFRNLSDVTTYTHSDIPFRYDSPKVLWGEKFLLGFYTATLSLTLAPAGSTIIKTIHFVAFPLQFLLLLGILCILIIVIIIRVRKRIFS